jgi:predicted nuclease with TOPRIM domain
MKFYKHVLYNVHDQNKEKKLKEKVKSIKTKKGKLNEMKKKERDKLNYLVAKWINTLRGKQDGILLSNSNCSCHFFY